MTDREIAELAVRDAMRLLAEAGLTQPFLSRIERENYEAAQRRIADGAAA